MEQKSVAKRSSLAAVKRSFGDTFIDTVLSTRFNTQSFTSRTDNDRTTAKTEEADENLHDLYCQKLDRHGFSCSDSYAASADYVANVCVSDSNGTDSANASSVEVSSSSCLNGLIFQRMHEENERLFYVYLYFATPLVMTALIFNAIALASIASLRHKLSRHVMLICMSVADTVVSVFALLRRIDGSLLGGTGGPFILAVWQMSWLLSALSLLGLAVDMFVALAKPYSYNKPVMKQATIWAICTAVALATGTAILLAAFGVQESDNSQYFACGIIVVIIAVISASHIYACVSAEMVQREMMRSQLQFCRQNSSNNNQESLFLRKSIVTTSLLITSSLLSWIPLLIYWLIDDSTKETNVPKFIRILTLCLICFHLNAVSNPLIYSFRFKDVRQSLKRIFRSYLLSCCPENVRQHISIGKSRKNQIVTLTKTDLLAGRLLPPKSNTHQPTPSVSQYSSSRDENKAVNGIALTEQQYLLNRSNTDFTFVQQQPTENEDGVVTSSSSPVNNGITASITTPPCLIDSVMIGSDCSATIDSNSGNVEPDSKLLLTAGTENENGQKKYGGIDNISKDVAAVVVADGR